jgi:acyl-homoserine-lactone acylase
MLSSRLKRFFAVTEVFFVLQICEFLNILFNFILVFLKMKKLAVSIFCILNLVFFQIQGQSFTQLEPGLWKKHAANVLIKRDKWGIPHIEGKTDADAVFGLIYAQCEDDFERIERNYIEKLGRNAELDGEISLYGDLFNRILLDQNEAQKEYQSAELWLKELLNAHAAGINFYLKKHPNVKPKLLTHFEPWYPLLWTDGSIGAINTAEITKDDVKDFFQGGFKSSFIQIEKEQDYQQTGSNGFAIAPAKSTSGYALLYINPHTTFFYRPEVHIKSNTGLNTYGAVTWGQFFVYQGFNAYCGWMHTSSNADVADVFYETLKEENGKTYYKSGDKWLLIKEKTITLKCLFEGKLENKNFKVKYTRNGPIVAQKNGQMLSLQSYNRSKKSLIQSWQRTKAKGYSDFWNTMNLKANTSNNTVYADKNGTIAYWHGDYMPRRDPAKNWSQAQDGSVIDTKNTGLHELSEIVSLKNPTSNWLQNCNSTPFTAAGDASPKKANYPAYMAPDGENFRGVRASKLLNTNDKVDLDGLIKLGYDNYLTAFEVLINGLKARGFTVPDAETQEVLDTLYKWDFRTSNTSIATTVAVEWAQKLNPIIRKIYIDQDEDDQVQATKRFIETATFSDIILPLREAYFGLKNNFGIWKKPWGEYNRFQRTSSDDEHHLDKEKSIPVPFASALWGCLPSFNSKKFNNSMLRYGYSGNSFVCAVEFGKKVKAKSLLAGGNSGDVKETYFNNQGENYSKGIFKDVLFYAEDVNKGTIKKYKPGSEIE